MGNWKIEIRISKFENRTWEFDSDGRAREKTGQGGLHDQRGGGVVQAAPADATAVRARGAAEAVAFAGEHAAVHGFGPRAAGCDCDAGAGYGREPGGHRNYFEHAREDDRDGAADGGVRASGAAGVVAGGGVAYPGESAAARDRASDATVGAIEQFSVVSRQQLVSKKRTVSSFHSFPNEDSLPWDVRDRMLSAVGKEPIFPARPGR